MAEAIARSNGETVQIHGAEAVRRRRLSTQVPTAVVFHTSVSIRTITVAGVTVRSEYVDVTLDYRHFKDEFDPFCRGRQPHPDQAGSAGEGSPNLGD